MTLEIAHERAVFDVHHVTDIGHEDVLDMGEKRNKVIGRLHDMLLDYCLNISIDPTTPGLTAFITIVAQWLLREYEHRAKAAEPYDEHCAGEIQAGMIATDMMME